MAYLGNSGKTESTKMRTFLAVMFFVLCFVPTAPAQLVASRTLPVEVYTPGTQFVVTIQLTGSPGTITVVERPPADWGIDLRTADGQLGEDVITWDLTTFSGSQTLEYWITPPSDATGPRPLFRGCGRCRDT